MSIPPKPSASPIEESVDDRAPPSEELFDAWGGEERPAPWWSSSPALSFFFAHQRVLRGMVILIFTVLLGGGLWLSNIGEHHGLLIFGSDPSHWPVGGQIALRVEGRKLPLQQQVHLRKAEVIFVDSGGIQMQAQPLKQRVGPFLQGNLNLPTRPGEWRLTVRAVGVSPKGIKGAIRGSREAQEERVDVQGQVVSLHARLPFEMATKGRSPIPQAPTSKVNVSDLVIEPASTPTTLVARVGVGALSLFAADQRLSFELASDVFIISQDEEGDPWSGEVKLSLTEGQSVNALPAQVMTDDRGVGLIHLTPSSLSLNIKATAHIDDPTSEEDGPTITHESLWPIAHQTTLSAQRQRLKGEAIVGVTARTVSGAKKLFVDLWDGPHWMSTHAISTPQMSGVTQVQLPSMPYHTAPRLLWVQAYKTPYLIGDVRGGSHLLWSPALERGGSPTPIHLDALTWLRDHLIARSVEPQGYWSALSAHQLKDPRLLRLALGRIKRPRHDPKLLVDSATSSVETTRRARIEYHKSFLLLMSGLCSLLCLTLGWMMWIHHRDLTLKLEWSTTERSHYFRQTLWRWFLPVAFVFLVFFGGVMILVSSLRW